MTLPAKNTLGKSERIYGTKRIDELFTSGEAFISYPLRIVYMKKNKPESGGVVSMMVSVPKKRFKRAVKRNRVKRLVREAFRLNKELFTDICNQYNIGLDVVFIYLKDELPEYKEIEKAVKKTAAIIGNKQEEAVSV